MTTEQFCDAVDTYPEAAERILSMLASARYIASATGGEGAHGWVLVVDTQQATLLKMFETFAVSGQNTLVRESLACTDSAQGSLAHWWRSLAGASALTTPLAQIFAEPDSKPVSESTDESAPESADAPEAIETTETSVTASVLASETEGECSPAAAAPAEIEPSAQAK